MIHDKIVMLSRACTPYKAVAGPGFNLRGRGVDFVNGGGGGGGRTSMKVLTLWE